MGSRVEFRASVLDLILGRYELAAGRHKQLRRLLDLGLWRGLALILFVADPGEDRDGSVILALPLGVPG